VPAREMAY